MTPGERLTLQAMKNELKRLSRIAKKAQEEWNECMGIPSELFAIHKDLSALVNSGEPVEDQIEKIDELKHRSDRAHKIMKKDLMKLDSRQRKAKLDRDELAREIQHLEFRLSLRTLGKGSPP